MTLPILIPKNTNSLARASVLCTVCAVVFKFDYTEHYILRTLEG